MKRAFTTFLSLLIVILANGQVVKSLGMQGGISLANQTWKYKTFDRTFKKDYIVGSSVALTFEFFNSKYLSLITDLGYSGKGNTEKILHTTVDMPEGDGTYDKYKTTFDYLTVSPMLGARYETTHFIPYVLVGLRLDYQLSYHSELFYFDKQTDFHKTIWGVNVGAGIEYKIKNVGIFAEGQYQYDFTKVLDKASSANNAGLEITNNAFIINVGVKYYLSMKQDAK